MNHNKIDEMAEIIFDIYSNAQLKIIQEIARRVAKGVPEAKWQRQKLAELNGLLVETGKIMDKANDKAIPLTAEQMQEAFLLGYNDVGVDLPPAVSMIGIDKRKVIALAEELLKMKNSAIIGTNSVYRKVVNESVQLMATGVYTRKQATQEALIKFAARGVGGFRDRAGRQWSLEGYARMATRTSYVRANLTGTLDRMEEFGYDKVIVSDHPGESALCRPFENKILIADRPRW